MPQFRLIGGHVALDLVNTVAPRPAGPDSVEHLTGPPALLAWARRTALLTDAEAAATGSAWAASPGAAEAELTAVLDLREAVHDVLTAADEGRNRLMRHFAVAVTRSEFLPGEPGGPPVVLRAGAGPHLIVDRLTHAAVDLLRTADPAQIKACPVDAGGCGWLFLDRSRNGSRRWCTMEDCGTHAKSRRLTQRRRAARST